jgi:outer membrane protein OmpA-like peptidoglycan-associated protein
MKLTLIIILLITISQQANSLVQQETYTIKKAPFSSDIYDEFSPVFYKNGIVFCSNRDNSMTSYSTSQDKGLFKMNFIDTAGKRNWQSSALFSKNLTSRLNDGPATFNARQDTIIYSRNLEVNSSLRDISSQRNKLGLFSAVLVDGKWTKIRELRINNEWYNVTTPYLSPDGKKLFFASDKPGGYGKFDIYYCLWKGDYWDDPVNLGPNINTKGNEAYPFINAAGELFFSSDGHPGLGGKDIFFSHYSDTTWMTPVLLDPPINSAFDDFGIITDSTMISGYFSSNRGKSIDIYQFKTNFPQIFYSDFQKTNQYCFVFNDSGAISVDTLNLRYIWNFGDGKKASGAIVRHCYPGPGNYDVKLNIIDKATGNLFFSKLSYKLDLKDIEQAFISSPDFSIKGDEIEFDGLRSFFPGNKILSYSWDLGDGTRLQGEKAKHTYNTSGKFIIRLGLTLKDSTGNIHKAGSSKKIVVFNTVQEKTDYILKNPVTKSDWPDIRKYRNAHVEPLYSAESEFTKDGEFQVEIASSKTKIALNSNLFRNVPRKYNIEEIYNKDEGAFSYIIDHQINLMSTYIAFKEIVGSGFRNAQTKIEILSNPAAKELNNLKKIFGILTDTYFDNNDRLTSSGYMLLDQIVKIMNKYPGVKLEISVHTDNTGLPDNKLTLSRAYAQTIVNYLTDKGVPASRLIARGYGGTKPVAPNYLVKDRSLNRRVDFSIVRE